jgi:predicted Zn-dependent protease
VDVVLSPEGLIFTGKGTERRLWPYGLLRLTQGWCQGEQVRLEKGEGPAAEVLLVHDPAVLERLQLLAPQLVGRLATPRREGTRIRLALLGAVVAAVLLAAAYLWGIPALSYVAAPWVPIAWESRLGDAVLAHLAPPARQCRAEGVNAAVQALADRLTRGLTLPYPVRVIVVRDPRVNAFAVPGGRIVILGGLLEGTGTPEELMAVLAHELQHVLRRHATRALLEHASAGLLVSAVTGDASGALALGMEGARTLAVLRYSRRNEEEADSEGLRMMVAAGIDPRGMLAFLDRMQASEARGVTVPTYLSTHPDTPSRIARLREEARAHRFPPIVLPGVGEWRGIATGCGAGAGG